MTKQSVVLIVVALVLAGVYVTFFTDWFRKPQIQILAQIRPPRIAKNAAPAGDMQVYPVSFAFDKKYAFTEIRVVSVEDEKTNKFPHAVWHMIADSNSVPVKTFGFGAPLKGMKPKVPKARPDALAPEVPYRLCLESGSRTIQECFQEFSASHPHLPPNVAVWIGPEGDFSAAEYSAIKNSGAQPITLGPLVLRVETAALCALAVINSELQAHH